MNENVFFKANLLVNMTAFIEECVHLNKVLFDGVRDVSIIQHSNNKYEKEERFRKCSIAWGVAFITPFIRLLITNRFAMKYAAKLSLDFFAKEKILLNFCINI